MKQIKVGFIPNKKRTATIFGELAKYLSQNGIESHTIDLDQPVSTYPCTTVLISKVTDFIQNPQKDNNVERIKRLREYLEDVKPLEIESLSRMNIIMDRLVLNKLLNEHLSSIMGEEVTIPQFTHLETNINEKHDVKYPIIVKNLVACGTDASHAMAVISGPKVKIPESSFSAPILIQRFIPHSGVTLKGSQNEKEEIVDVFEVDDMEDEKPYEIDGNSISKSFLKRVSSALQTITGLAMFGFDIVIEKGTKKMFLIDLNYFPAFSGINMKVICEEFCNIILRKWNSEKNREN